MTLDDLLEKCPPPWTAEPCGRTGCECRLIMSSDGDIITLIGHQMDDIAPIVAPLLAVAPEMLTVCEALLKHCDKIGLEVEMVRSIVARARKDVPTA